MQTQIPLIRATKSDTNGSSLSGFLSVTYPHLVDRLGFPHDCTQEGEWFSADYKVRLEWAFKVPSECGSTVVTIYDYKKRTPIPELRLWNVGVKGDRDLARQFIQEHLSVPCAEHRD